MPKYLELAATNRAVLAVLWPERCTGPARSDADFIVNLIRDGWCLSPICPEPPGHCHWPMDGATFVLGAIRTIDDKPAFPGGVV